MKQTQLFDLLDKYFHWLINEYSFIYHRQEHATEYSSDKIRIQISWERYIPTIDIFLQGEPEYACLSFGWIISYFTKEKFNNNNSFYRSFDREENAKKLADLFKKQSNRIMYDIDTWWIPAHRNKLKIWEEVHGYKPVKSMSQLYEYVDGFD